MSDFECLQLYARENSQAAFAELVARYVNLVYSAAVRQVRSPQLAEEVAQSVFLELARRAAAIPPAQPLAAWLHVVTRRTAIDAIRRESRRLARETTAAEFAAMQTPSETWSKVEASVDEAMSALDETDRTALVLRFFQNLSLREVGESLGISEDTAQKRVSRAIEQLRMVFLRRGVTVTAAGLAADLGAHAIVTAPAALATTIVAFAATAVPTGTIATATMTTLQKSIAALVVASLAGLGLYEASVTSRQRAELARLNSKLTASNASLARPTLASSTPNQAPRSDTPPASDASRATPSPDQRVALLKQLFDELPAQRLPELRLLAADDWLEIARKHELESAADIRVALAELRAVARRNIADVLQGALRRYTDASGGQLPADMAQLAPFLTAPAEAEMLARYEMIRTGKLGDPSEKLVREKATSDLILSVGLNGWGLTNNSASPAAFGESEAATLDRMARAATAATSDDPAEQSKQATALAALANSMNDAMKSLGPDYLDEMKRAATVFAGAHPDETITDAARLLPFLKDPEKLIAAFRPVFAQMDYAREHDGQSPASPEQLQPYLARPFSAAEAFRAMKLTRDGERFNLDFDFPSDAPGKP